jgi:hypothetical protein
MTGEAMERKKGIRMDDKRLKTGQQVARGMQMEE